MFFLVWFRNSLILILIFLFPRLMFLPDQGDFWEFTINDPTVESMILQLYKQMYISASNVYIYNSVYLYCMHLYIRVWEFFRSLGSISLKLFLKILWFCRKGKCRTKYTRKPLQVWTSFSGSTTCFLCLYFFYFFFPFLPFISSYSHRVYHNILWIILKGCVLIRHFTVPMTSADN